MRRAVKEVWNKQKYLLLIIYKSVLLTDWLMLFWFKTQTVRLKASWDVELRATTQIYNYVVEKLW